MQKENQIENNKNMLFFGKQKLFEKQNFGGRVK